MMAGGAADALARAWVAARGGLVACVPGGELEHAAAVKTIAAAVVRVNQRLIIRPGVGTDLAFFPSGDRMS